MPDSEAHRSVFQIVGIDSFQGQYLLGPDFSFTSLTQRSNMAGPVYVLDNYYLAITLLITIAYQLFFFSIAFSFKFDKLTGT